MSLEVGHIVEGKVTGITNFGAFVELSNGQRVSSTSPRWPMPTWKTSMTT